MKRAGLSSAQRQGFLDDGYAVARAAAPTRLVAAARRWIDRRLSRGIEPVGGTPLPDYWTETTDAPELMALLFDSPLWGVAESLLGEPQRPPTAQVAVRFPSTSAAQEGYGLHVDGFYGQPGKPVEKVHRFALLIGVMVTAQPTGREGNFVVCPGSHLAFAEFAARRGVLALARGIDRQLAVGPPVPVLGRAGDVLLAHYQLVHDKGVNRTRRPRYMVYFRLHHRRAVDYGDRPFAEPWLEFPGLAQRRKPSRKFSTRRGTSSA